MIKRVNFTGRKRISRKYVNIEVFESTPLTFDARIALADLNLPAYASVFLEATCAGSNAVQRFDFGNVEAIKPHSSLKLTEVEGDNVYFTLKVIDTTNRFGRILGIAENIRPERAGDQTVTGRRGILPIEECDLKQELWKLEFRQPDVILLVNEKVPGLVDRMCSDPTLYSAVYPIVVRTVLARAIKEGGDVEDDDESWQKMWLAFGRELHPERIAPPESDDDPVIVDEWVDEIVGTFCENHRLKDKFALMLSGEEEIDQ